MRAMVITALAACSTQPTPPTTATKAAPPAPAGALYGPRPIPDGAHRMSISTTPGHGTARISLIISRGDARPIHREQTWGIPSCVALPENVEFVSIATDVRELSVTFDDAPSFDTLNESNCFEWDLERKLHTLGD